MISVIRPARPSDIDRLMEIFDAARRFMASSGNANQWVNGYPQRELIASEIAVGHCFACENGDGRVVGTFCFIEGPDPTYLDIRDGQWLDDAPYWVIHRLASDGSERGVANACLGWSLRQHPNIRIDTHADNRVMQNILSGNGFIRCGIILTHDGTPRIAYQRSNCS